MEVDNSWPIELVDAVFIQLLEPSEKTKRYQKSSLISFMGQT